MIYLGQPVYKPLRKGLLFWQLQACTPCVKYIVNEDKVQIHLGNAEAVKELIDTLPEDSSMEFIFSPHKEPLKVNSIITVCKKEAKRLCLKE